MKHYEVVCALIENEDGKYFCCRRGKGRALEGKWEFPGGKVEVGESKETTIIREIKEELSSLIQPISYLGSVSYEYHLSIPYSDFSITLYAYHCKLISGELTLKEHTEKAWVSIESMDTMDFAEADRILIKKVLKTSEEI